MKDFNSIKNSKGLSSLLNNEEYLIKSFTLSVIIQNIYKKTKNVGCYLEDARYLLRNKNGYTLVLTYDIVLVNNNTGEESTSNEKLKITVKQSVRHLKYN
jgi:hypothetical protein